MPEVVSFEYTDDDITMETMEATVMFIATKYAHSTDGDGGESFVVVCYDKHNVVHEIFLNNVTIVKTKKYGRQIESPRDTSKKRRRKRTVHANRADNTGNKENKPEDSDSVYLRNGNTGEADGSEAGGHSIL